MGNDPPSDPQWGRDEMPGVVQDQVVRQTRVQGTDARAAPDSAAD
jgi:hypothetical protein